MCVELEREREKEHACMWENMCGGVFVCDVGVYACVCAVIDMCVKLCDAMQILSICMVYITMHCYNL